jgi:hypothetical protein
MTRQKKKVQSGNSGLETKQASGELLSFSGLNIQALDNPVNISDLTSPQIIRVCWLCGSSQNVITYHASGGVLGVCDRCNGGQA